MFKGKLHIDKVIYKIKYYSLLLLQSTLIMLYTGLFLEMAVAVLDSESSHLKVSIYACLYIIIAVIANAMVEFYGEEEAKLSLDTGIPFILISWKSWNDIFTNSGANLSWKDINLFPIGLILSTLYGINLFIRLKERWGFYTSNLISLIASSIVDSIVSIIAVALFIWRFTPIDKLYKLSTLLPVVLYSMLYKLSYILIAALVTLYLVKRGRKLF